ncbi:fumarate hydratase [Methanogenium organophilum]|uniref:Fumarate hydratase n=1 Tax=Methanogenium organophilum TaxID=2199 RepID=A0A9X9S5J4_METOG|nr:fumarate hydratase [Methanogenium organophilum]WAI01843.1 fumarate hydratase [Methanogenium organophilum]
MPELQEQERIRAAVAQATADALREAEIHLPPDVKAALKSAYAAEESPVARSELEAIFENIETAERRNVPICQDTGVPVVYITIPPAVPYTDAITEGVRDGVRQATKEVPLRPNVVSPCTRENSGDNCGAGMPAVHISPGDTFTLTVLPKGAGSENVSALRMFLPSETGKIAQFITECMLRAGGKPCPPVILGIGIGSTADGAAALAKEALLEPLGEMTAFEQEIYNAVNALGIGPMGLGGKTTCLGVRIRKGGCHTASLPVALNVQCWAARRATVEVQYP